MNDITTLAQRMKAAAEKARQANALYLEGKIKLSECVIETKDYLDYSDNPNNVLALIEALEKVRNWEMQWKEAAERRGKRLTRQALEILKQEQRIAELEARNGEQLLRSLTLVLRQYNDYGQISLEAIEEAEFEIKTAIVAGIGVKGE